MTATKLDQVREYVENMFPIFRAAVALSATGQARNEGYDEAARNFQEALLKILDSPDG